MNELPTIGEFEQLVLLAVLQLRDRARAADIRARIEREADRRVARGALYVTLDRLVEKGLLDWEVEEATPARGGIPRRCFRVTARGMEAVRRSYRAVRALARGLEGELGRA